MVASPPPPIPHRLAPPDAPWERGERPWRQSVLTRSVAPGHAPRHGLTPGLTRRRAGRGRPSCFRSRLFPLSQALAKQARGRGEKGTHDTHGSNGRLTSAPYPPPPGSARRALGEGRTTVEAVGPHPVCRPRTRSAPRPDPWPHAMPRGPGPTIVFPLTPLPPLPSTCEASARERGPGGEAAVCLSLQPLHDLLHDVTRLFGQVLRDNQRRRYADDIPVEANHADA